MFAYDVGGNITSRTKYAYTTGTLGTAISTDTYTYDTVNKDRLVSYNGQAITYDVKGNPTTYKGNALTWDRVRLLSSYGNNTYAYNADGIRVRKNDTHYTLDGSNIMHEYDNSGKNIYYYYGVDGLYGFRIGEDDYFYKKNLQGDITDIYHEDGTKYASYEYDAWGNCTITLDTNGIGTLNPFRYRGYYYDSETGLYYLKSRYYDPAVGRFINADNIFDRRSILGYNLYAYCLNNPSNRVDLFGHISIFVAIAGLVLITGALSGCSSSTQSPSQFGVAPVYKDIKASNGNRNNNPNCYAYAIGLYDKSYNPGDFSSPFTAYDVEAVAQAVESDFLALGRGCRRIASYDSEIEADEYRIALRVSDAKPMYHPSHGIYVDWDYHFMVQTSTGNWAEKHGAGGSSVYHSNGNPSTISWDLGNIKGYYTSEIIYFAITN